jgi:hypothetical protein
MALSAQTYLGRLVRCTTSNAASSYILVRGSSMMYLIRVDLPDPAFPDTQ